MPSSHALYAIVRINMTPIPCGMGVLSISTGRASQAVCAVVAANGMIGRTRDLTTHDEKEK